MMDPYVAIVALLIFIAIIAGIGKITSKKAKKVYALGLSGQGLTKIISDLNVTKDGDILKDDMANKQFTITTSPILFEKGRKRVFGYLVDMEKGCTVNLQKSGSVVDLKTNPELVSNVIDSRLIQDAFGLRPYRGMILAVGLVFLGLGYLIGLMF